MTATADHRGSGSEPSAGVEPAALLGLTPGELALRFFLGAAASVAAGLVSLAWGARAGGVLLAVPAIFVASITLEERKGGRDEVQHQVSGAPIGALGMVAFALTVTGLLGRLPLAAVLAAATGAWAVTALAGYLVVEAIRRRLDEAS